MAIGVEHRVRDAASRLDHALHLRPIQSTAMPFDTLSHTSGIGLPVTETASIHNSTDHSDLDTTIPGQGIVPSLHQQSNKKRRPSKGKVAPEIRRSSSTPHMRNLALATSGELSPTADKRRNKLGYHRTSVACGHCRRRKIRCLVANDDPQGRCANCIRLKKECNFYPVEQTPEIQRSQTSSAKEPSAGAPTSSTTSSPRHPSSASGEKIEEFRPPFATVTTKTPTPRYGLQPDVDVAPSQVPHSSAIPMPHPPYTYPQQIETQWSTPGFLPSSSVTESSPSSSGYWRPSPSAANSTYGSETNMSGGQTPATMSTTSNMSYGGQHDNHSWAQPNLQPPTRSMSYGNIEGIPNQYPGSGLGIQQHDYPRRTSPYPYPTTIDTNTAIMHTTTLGDSSSAPLSAPILPNHQYSYPQTWTPYGGLQNPTPDMPLPSRSMSAQWYGEPGHLDQVQEEGGPSMAYGHHNMQQFYSGA
ncbi:uncharacterized protein BDR25DRAFT_80582 [Lindgomyces ingoldianus]|uniref:Uncharacterized protein n=1 Tax=Lindgomyces ingoldianus TaxID=673940 RepID=A0ACB6QH36_9PLEO|nr:uncharacterized protein BDR25DRAFT_80582 [Lindgomyces ingoldianus]KAF2465878.1 hypothetical protein BDR25DRAFT_80582 [Lindgomyces ingoldianus]